MPLLALVTLNEVTHVILLALHTVADFIFERLLRLWCTFIAYSLRTGPLSLLKGLHRISFLLTDWTLNTTITIPAVFRHLRQLGVQAVNVHALVAHFTNYHFVFHYCSVAILTSLTVRAVPVKPIDESRVQRGFVALSMLLFTALAALQLIAFNC